MNDSTDMSKNLFIEVNTSTSTNIEYSKLKEEYYDLVMRYNRQIDLSSSYKTTLGCLITQLTGIKVLDYSQDYTWNKLHIQILNELHTAIFGVKPSTNQIMYSIEECASLVLYLIIHRTCSSDALNFVVNKKNG